MTGPRRDDREMDAILRSWLADDAGPAPDRSGQVGRVMGRIEKVDQRRRLWPRVPFGRRAAEDREAGTEASIAATSGRISVLVPGRAMSVVVVAVLLSVSLLWVASRSVEQQLVPAGWPVDADDRALFKGFVAVWDGEDTDRATLQETYAEDAQFRLLWLDEEEVVSGQDAIRDRIRELQPAETERDLYRLSDHFSGARRYLLTAAAVDPSALAGSACVLWIKDDRIRLHDCVVPTSLKSKEWPALAMPDASAEAEREELANAFHEQVPSGGPAGLEAVVSPDVRHHVLSTNQVYTLEGLTEYGRVMSFGQPTTEADVSLPAPQGELRWANFSGVGSGSLCVFWARDSLITRHDCIMPSASTVPASLTEIGSPPGS